MLRVQKHVKKLLVTIEAGPFALLLPRTPSEATRKVVGWAPRSGALR